MIGWPLTNAAMGSLVGACVATPVGLLTLAIALVLAGCGAGLGCVPAQELRAIANPMIIRLRVGKLFKLFAPSYKSVKYYTFNGR